MKFKKSIVAAALLLAAAHAGAQDWRGAITTEESEFKPYVSLRSDVTDQRVEDVRYLSLLFGNVSKIQGEPMIFGVYVSARYVAEHRLAWTIASTDRGEWLEVSDDDRKVESCTRRTCIFINDFSVLLKPEMLKRAASEGLRIQFRGVGTQYTLAVDQTQAQLMLKAAEETQERFK